MSTDASLLEARGMCIWRGENLLVDDVSIRVDRGDIVQIQGSNGTGKTTLLRALIGLAEFDDGEVFWQGKPVAQVRDDMHNQLLYLGHKPGITGGLTPAENLVALCPELGRDSTIKGAHRSAIQAVLDELGIGDRIDLPSRALSAGQQRRVALARLRLQSATLWVLDEPLTSLDVQGHDWVRQEIQHHVEVGGAVLFTTHQTIAFDSAAVKAVTLAVPT